MFDNNNEQNKKSNHHPIIDLLQSKSNNQNTNKLSSKYCRVINSLQWRQKYQNQSYYEIEINNINLVLSQISNGEMKGLGTGTFVWPAAHVLSKYLEKNYPHSLISSMRICDVGSGTGITGFAASTLGAKEVILTDQGNILFLLENNRKSLIEQCRHVNKHNIKVKEYNWGENPDDLDPPFDLILISDCVLPKLYPIELLIQAVVCLMDEKTIALFSYEHRPYPQYDPRQEFRRLCEIYDLYVELIPISEHDSYYCCDDIEIWKVKKKASQKLLIEVNKTLDLSMTKYVQPLNWGDDLQSINLKVLVPLYSNYEYININIIQNISNNIIGSILWPSSVVSSRYILSHDFNQIQSLIFTSGICQNKNRPIALELGSGCGLTAICLWLRGYDVFATDKETIIPSLSLNITNIKSYIQFKYNELYMTLGIIEVIEFDWISNDNINNSITLKEKIYNIYDNSIDQSNFSIDLIICSDCLYSSHSTNALLDCIYKLSSFNTIILIANELRTAFENFLSIAKKNREDSVSGKMDIKEITLTENDMEIIPNINLRPIRLLISKVIN